ncbi:HDOD domain-containing protein [Nitriliruptoraceae bacterium ZYF776]|nr:HDOD domain-containing protein [Profundirhabdus halotolerans]
MIGVLGELMVARQPLLDADVRVVGYQLEHRAHAAVDPVSAARVLVDGLLTLGRRELTGGADAWIEIPDPLLRSGVLLDLPGVGTVLTLAPGAEVDAELADGIVRHRVAGYRVALGRVVPDDPRAPLLDLVDHATVDLAATPDGLALVRRFAAAGVDVLVTGVHAHDTVELAFAAGARLVQGTFWTRAREVRAVRPRALAPGHLDLLAALAADEVDLDEVEQLIRTDLTLTDRFLRLLRTTAGHRPITSIRDGLLVLGVRAVRRWVALLVVAGVDEDANPELVRLASSRARGCELLQELRGGDDLLGAFSVGMFSVLGDDGFLPPSVLETLPVDGDVRAALADGSGPLRPLLDTELAAERASWDRFEASGQDLGLSSGELAAAHVEALVWSAAFGNPA